MPPIVEDFEPLLLAVEGGQSREQRRLITRDDDKKARHLAGPPSARGKQELRQQHLSCLTLGRFIRRGKHKTNPPTDPVPGVSAVPLRKAVLRLTQAMYVRGRKGGKYWKCLHAEAKCEVAALTPKTPRAPGTASALVEAAARSRVLILPTPQHHAGQSDKAGAEEKKGPGLGNSVWWGRWSGQTQDAYRKSMPVL